VGALSFGPISVPLAVNVYSLRSAILAILVIASFGSGPVWAEEDEYGSRAPFPAGPLRQIDDALKPYGIRPSVSYTGEVLGNASGGIWRGAMSRCGSASSAPTSSSTQANMPAVSSTRHLAGRQFRA
jgi:hypothetical protein